MRFNLALVTGASSGIGMALCKLLANKGINLIIHGRNLSRLEELAQQLRSQVTVEIVCADLGEKDGVNRLIECIHEKKPDLVINNAGFGLYGEALTYETDEQLAILQVDGQAVLALSLEAARTMISAGKKGVIMNISSASAFSIFPNFAVYSATKALVNQFSESFDEEMKPYGIRVLTSCPGVVATNFRGRAGGEEETPGLKTMSVEFAANEIWTQILKGKKIHIFNWSYRLSLFFVRFFLPKSWVVKIISKNMEKIYTPKPIIKIKQ